MIPPLERVPNVLERIRDEVYLAISGPRQSGKTSLLTAIVDSIQTEGWAHAVLVTCESAGALQGVEEVGEAEQRLIEAWHLRLAQSAPGVAWPAAERFSGLAPGGRVGAALSEWAAASDKPLVLVIDEIDTLARLPFFNVIAQIRGGYPNRGKFFPHSILLAGLRSLRDHDIALGGDGRGSPFNIVESIAVTNFSRAEVGCLVDQHTADTGQRFSEAAIDRVWEQTQGQPWLVNMIARSCVSEWVTDRGTTIEPHDIDDAIRQLESSNATHLASLVHRLSEDRILNVVAPVVVGDAPNGPPDDVRYTCELGILEPLPGDRLRPANPIYARTLLRAVTERERRQLVTWSPSWLVDGRIDVDQLRDNFLAFWSLHRNMMKDRITYPEAVAHFGLMTYLDRVVNGGGRIDREFAVGSGRLDLLLRHGDLKLPIEVKVHRDHSVDPVPSGLEQLDRYCEGLRVDRAWLVVFDQRSSATGTRLESEEVTTNGGRRVLIIRA